MRREREASSTSDEQAFSFADDRRPTGCNRLHLAAVLRSRGAGSRGEQRHVASAPWRRSQINPQRYSLSPVYRRIAGRRKDDISRQSTLPMHTRTTSLAPTTSKSSGKL